MGLNVVNIFLFGITFILLAISAGFATDAARRLGGSKDPDLNSAHNWLTLTAVIAWISVALILIGGGLYLFFFGDTIELTGNWVVYGMLGLSLILVILIGVFSAIAASKMGNTKADNNGAYKQAIIAAVLGIIGFVFIMAILLIKLFHKPKKGSTTESLFSAKLPDWAKNVAEETPEIAEALEGVE